jgi:response regulator RpfG family c-di-GMP phosphodiesterase
MKVFVLDFSASKEFESLFHQVPHIIETIDSGAAYKKIRRYMPDQIFINYDSAPQYCLQTILSVRWLEKTSTIPVFFVNGCDGSRIRARELGLCINKNDITPILSTHNSGQHS